MHIDLSTSSESFLKGVRWLENELKFDEKKLRNTIQEKEVELGKESDATSKVRIKYQTEYLNARLRSKYRCDDVEAIYVLKKLRSKLADEFVSAASKRSFWSDEDSNESFVNDIHKLWFLKEVGLGDNPHFLEVVDSVVKDQSVEGFIHSNELEHAGPMRVLVATKPQSEALSNAVNYWLGNWKARYEDRADNIAIGILALTELDYEKYSSAIREEIDYLKSLQKEDGSWSWISRPKSKGRIRETSHAIWAISRVWGNEDSRAKNGLEWLIEKQQKNGSWGHSSTDTANALQGLLAMGEGPKISVEFVDYQFMKLRQNLKRQKPIFIHTSPLYHDSLHVKEIYSKVSNMIHNAQKEIRITSPFIDMLYEEIINLKQEKPNLTVKIITRPKRDVGGTRERIARNVIDLLNIATKGNTVQSDLVHSRMIIIDDEEVLVSSADLTRDQLFDEYNAAIWTSDKDTVKKAIEFFDNLFQTEKGDT